MWLDAMKVIERRVQEIHGLSESRANVIEELNRRLGDAQHTMEVQERELSHLKKAGWFSLNPRGHALKWSYATRIGSWRALKPMNSCCNIKSRNGMSSLSAFTEL